MTDEDWTIEDLRRALADPSSLADIMEIVASDSPPLVHAALAAQLHRHGQEMRDHARALRKHGTHPEHKELANAMRTAAQAADVAFDAALNAAWQLYWITNQCECEACTQRRRMERAEQN